MSCNVEHGTQEASLDAQKEKPQRLLKANMNQTKYAAFATATSIQGMRETQVDTA